MYTHLIDEETEAIDYYHYLPNIIERLVSKRRKLYNEVEKFPAKANS